MSETFGQRLRRLREAKGWSTAELACKAGMDHKAIEHAENNSVLVGNYQSSDLLRLANVFGVTMDYLYTGRESWANTPGKRIRQRRDELGWDFEECYKDFAEEGLSPHALLEVDAKGYCGEDMVDSIADHLGVTPEWIMTGAEPKFPEPPKPIASVNTVEWNPPEDGRQYVKLSLSVKAGKSAELVNAINAWDGGEKLGQ